MTNPSEICITVPAYRLDCGCLYYQCEGGTELSTNIQIDSCLIDNFFTQNGKYDFNCDQLETEANIVLRESVGVCSDLFDGSIQNLMCLLDSDNNCTFPATGSFKYTDDYGIIYVVQWESYQIRIDITWTTFDPRIPGEEPSGFMNGRQVYRKGIITTTRQIVEKDEDDNVTIIEEAVEQKVDYFRTTFDCGDVLSDDPFRYHLDCAVSDELEIFESGSGGSGSSG